MSVDSKTLASTVEEISSMDDSALAQAVRRVHRESAEASDPIAAFGRVQSAQLISLVDAAPRGEGGGALPPCSQRSESLVCQPPLSQRRNGVHGPNGPKVT